MKFSVYGSYSPLLERSLRAASPVSLANNRVQSVHSVSVAVRNGFSLQERSDKAYRNFVRSSNAPREGPVCAICLIGSTSKRRDIFGDQQAKVRSRIPSMFRRPSSQPYRMAIPPARARGSLVYVPSTKTIWPSLGSKPNLMGERRHLSKERRNMGFIPTRWRTHSTDFARNVALEVRVWPFASFLGLTLGRDGHGSALGVPCGFTPKCLR